MFQVINWLHAWKFLLGGSVSQQIARIFGTRRFVTVLATASRWTPVTGNTLTVTGLPSLTCSDYWLLLLAGTWTRQAICPLRKDLCSDGCLAVEPRRMGSLLLKVSAIGGRNHFCWGPSLLGEGAVPLYSYTLAFALLRKSTENLSQSSRQALRLAWPAERQSWLPAGDFSLLLAQVPSKLPN
jgi:hypothetical protein